MRLPFEPKSMEEHVQRYTQAIQETVDVESAAMGLTARPGEKRQCIFDFHDGMRVIVSRECLPTGVIVVHVSASVFPGTTLYSDVQIGKVSMEKFLTTVPKRFKRISGETRELVFAGLSHGKRVPHWFLDAGGGAEQVTTEVRE